MLDLELHLQLKKILWHRMFDDSVWSQVRTIYIRKCDVIVLVISCRGRISALTTSDAVNGGRPEQTEQPGWAASGAPEQSPVRDLVPAELHGPESLSLPESSHRTVGKSQPSNWYRKGGNSSDLLFQKIDLLNKYIIKSSKLMYFHSVRTIQLSVCENTNKKRVLSYQHGALLCACPLGLSLISHIAL